MNHYDSPWKESLDRHFPEFLEFFFPEMHTQVDWSVGYQMLDSELREILSQEDPGNREVDCLIRVHLKRGGEHWLLIHVEVQSQYDPDFPARMLIYHARILARYGRSCCSLAILGDDRPHWRPQKSTSSLWDCRLTLEFPIRKLLDYPAQAEQPENPFSWLVASHLQALATRNDPQARKAIKLKLTRGLHRAGLSRSQTLAFFRLVDWVLALPKELAYAFRSDLKRWEEENQVAYKTSIERMSWEEGLELGREQGLARGLDQGLVEGRRRMLCKAAQARWGIDITSRVGAIADVQQLETLMETLVTAESQQDWLSQFDGRSLQKD